MISCLSLCFCTRLPSILQPADENLNAEQVCLFPGVSGLYVIALEEAFLQSLVGGGEKRESCVLLRKLLEHELYSGREKTTTSSELLTE